MRKIIILLSVILSQVVNAECYLSSGYRADDRNMVIVGHDGTGSRIPSGPPRDFRRAVTPYNTDRFICTVFFRVPIDGTWLDVKGQAIGKNSESEDKVCNRAVDLRYAEVLAHQGNVVPIAAETQMNCTEMPERKVRVVQVGEYVYESEVDLSYNPKYVDYPQFPFFINGVEHKFFIERQGQAPTYRVLTGIIRRVESGPNGRWQVIDKF